jgi:hypothetical protein
VEDLTTALDELHRRHLILLPTGRTVTIWGPNKRVPRWLRQTIHQHRREVLAMIQRSETAVCPNPMLHEAWYSLFAGRMVCDVCSRLRREIVAIDTPTRRHIRDGRAA